MFFKKKKIEKQARKIDKLITWLIVWWAVASMIGLTKTEKWKEITKKAKSEWTQIAKKWYKFFGEVMVKTLNLFNKK